MSVVMNGQPWYLYSDSDITNVLTSAGFQWLWDASQEKHWTLSRGPVKKNPASESWEGLGDTHLKTGRIKQDYMSLCHILQGATVPGCMSEKWSIQGYLV